MLVEKHHNQSTEEHSVVRNNSLSANRVKQDESSENYVEDDFESSKEKSLAKGVTNDNITDEIEK